MLVRPAYSAVIYGATYRSRLRPGTRQVPTPLQLMQIVEFQHVKPGKGPAFVRTKLKNVLSGKVVDQTFNAGIKVDTGAKDLAGHPGEALRGDPRELDLRQAAGLGQAGERQGEAALLAGRIEQRVRPVGRA